MLKSKSWLKCAGSAFADFEFADGLVGFDAHLMPQARTGGHGRL